jgi:hypothetical protein
MRLRLAASVVAASLLVGGCGGDEGGGPSTTTASGPPSRLVAAERRRVLEAERAIAAYCDRVAAAAIGQAELPPRREQRRALARVDRLIELAARDPAAEIETGVSMRLFISDLAEDLQGSNCDRRLVELLDAALAGLLID